MKTHTSHQVPLPPANTVKTDNIPAVSSKHWQTSENTGKHRQTLANTGSLKQTLANTGKHWKTPAKTGKHRQCQANTGEHRKTLANTGKQLKSPGSLKQTLAVKGAEKPFENPSEKCYSQNTNHKNTFLGRVYKN